MFLDEFNSFPFSAATTPHEFIITGDFNIHLDNHSDHATSQFLSLLSSFNLTQHVNFPTHNHNHILDLIITSSDTSLHPSLSVTHCSPSDHFPIFTKLPVTSSNVPLIPPSSLHRYKLLSFWSTVLYRLITTLQNHLALSWSLTIPLCLLHFTNMHQ